jgi:hypothetical protein
MPDALEVVRPEQISAMSLLQLAVDRGANIDTIERLAKLQREMMDHSAQVEFNHAMQRCQEKMKRIATDMENPQTRSRYASYAQIDRAIRPIYTAEGISLSFGDGEPIAPETVRIICYVAKAGFTRIYHKDMPVVTVGPQGKAVMTPTHATGSAAAYAKRYLVKDIFNLAVGEDDNDGNEVRMDEGAVIDWCDQIEACSTLDELKPVFAKAYKASADDKNAMGRIIRSYEARKKAIGANNNR